VILIAELKNSYSTSCSAIGVRCTPHTQKFSWSIHIAVIAR